MPPIPAVTIETLIQRYDVLLFDAYGVLVHAAGAMPGACALVAALNAQRKPYFIVTNDASKLPAGAACAVLGTRDSVRYVELAGGRPVPPDGEFEVLVVADETGYPLLESVDAALTALFHRLDAGRSVQLAVPNPDLIYPRGTRSFGIAAGSIALMIEAALERRFGSSAPRFVRLGKPAPDLYRAALGRAGGGRAVMIGDQLETDIAGAVAAGIDAALVTTGVSAVPDDLPPALRPAWQLASIAPAGAEEAARVQGAAAPDEIDK